MGEMTMTKHEYSRNQKSTEKGSAGSILQPPPSQASEAPAPRPASSSSKISPELRRWLDDLIIPLMIKEVLGER
jgi:hypothetical protein